jgi:hypothetical protein
MGRPSLESRALVVRSLLKLQRRGRLTGWEIRSAARALGGQRTDGPALARH